MEMKTCETCHYYYKDFCLKDDSPVRSWMGCKVHLDIEELKKLKDG